MWADTLSQFLPKHHFLPLTLPSYRISIQNFYFPTLLKLRMFNEASLRKQR